MTATLAAHRAQAKIFPAHFTATVLNATHFRDGLCAAQRQNNLSGGGESRPAGEESPTPAHSNPLESMRWTRSITPDTEPLLPLPSRSRARPTQLNYDPTWLSRP